MVKMKDSIATRTHYPVILTRGLPGSGKSAWAKEFVREHPYYWIVSRDALRSMVLGGGDWPWGATQAEADLTHIEISAIVAAYQAGRAVIVDSTLLDPLHYAYLSDGLRQYHIRTVSQEFRNVPLEVCLARNLRRTGPARLRPEIIESMYNRHVKDLGLEMRPLSDFPDYRPEELLTAQERANMRNFGKLDIDSEYWGQGCPIGVFEDWFQTPCGKGASDGKCPTHGLFAVPPAA